MKKVGYISVFLILALVSSKVYAFTYEFGTNVDSKSVSVGAETEIKVSLKNIQGTSDGIASCSLGIQLDDNIVLNPKVRTLGSWTMTVGDIYLFDTGDPVTDNSEFFVIPVKVNGSGAVSLVNIVCSDGNTNDNIDNQTINFTISNSANNSNNSNNNSSNNSQDNINNNGNNGTTNNEQETGTTTPPTKDSNCDLLNIELSEGTIEFDAAVTEYSIEVHSYKDLIVTPILASSKSTFVVDRTDGKIVITVKAEDGLSKIYTIFVSEKKDVETNNNETDANYTPIFIVILCVLVLINVFRIIKKNKS